MKMTMVVLASLIGLTGASAFAKDATLDCAMADSVLSLHADLSAMTLSGPFTYHGISPRAPAVTGVASFTNSPDQPVLHLLLQTVDGKTFATLDVDTTQADDNGTLTFASSGGFHLGCDLR